MIFSYSVVLLTFQTFIRTGTNLIHKFFGQILSLFILCLNCDIETIFSPSHQRFTVETFFCKFYIVRSGVTLVLLLGSGPEKARHRSGWPQHIRKQKISSLIQMLHFLSLINIKFLLYHLNKHFWACGTSFFRRKWFLYNVWPRHLITCTIIFRCACGHSVSLFPLIHSLLL